MTAKHDLKFLALLVHRGHIEREDAERLIPPLKQGRALDALLSEHLGWSEKKVRRMRVTRAGEEPRIPASMSRAPLNRA